MEWVKLDEIISIKKGKKLLEIDAPTENSIRYIQIEDLRDDSNLKYTEDKKAVLANEDDILIAWDGANAGTIGFRVSGAIGSTIAKLSIKKSFRKKFTYEFLGYFLKSKNNYLVATSTGATIPHISRNSLINIKVPLIDLEEQEKLIDIFETLENLIQTRQDQIQDLDDLVESLYYEFVFTNSEDYQKVKLDDIAKVRSSSRVFKKDLIDEGIPFYRGQEISMLSKNIEFEPEFYINEELYNSMKEKSGIPKKGDLLLPSIANEGQIWVVDTDKEFYFKDGRVLWINLDENNEVNSIYLRYYLKYKLIQEFDSISSGSTFAELKIFILKDIDILLPPIGKQNQFAAFVEKIEGQKQILNDSLGELTNLFDSLMQDAFDGSMTK